MSAFVHFFQRDVLPLVRRLRALPFGLGQVLLLGLAFFALREHLWHGQGSLDQFDDALLLNNAQMMNDGRVIYRDFSANYPPGIFQLVRPILALGLPGVWTLRLVGLFVRVASAVLAAVVVGRARGTRPCLATGTIVLMLQGGLNLIPYAYSVAMVLVLALVLAWPTVTVPRWRSFVAGATFALISYVRVDLFCYAGAAIFTLEATRWVARKTPTLLTNRRIALDFGAGLAGTTLLLWAPHVLDVGISRLAHDLALDVARLAMPARWLPLPLFSTPTPVAALETVLPAWLVYRGTFSLVLAFASTAAGAGYLFWKLKSRELVSARVVIGVLLTLFAVSTLPQALGRTDYHHVVYGAPLTLAVLGTVLGPQFMRVLVLGALMTWVHERAHFINAAQALQLFNDRADERFMIGDRKAIISVIQAETAPTDPIFVGCKSHRRHIFSPLDIYYWSKRHGATRYMQFDPGLTTSAEVHEQMIADLERTQPKLAVRYQHCLWDEPNASRVEGSPLLDEYLSSHYELFGSSPSFEVLVRKSLLTTRDDHKLPP